MGMFGGLFAPGDGAIVYKVFRRAGRDPVRERAGRAVFEAEVAAYRIAVADPGLRRYVPGFHGVVRVQAIRDAGGHSRLSDYLPDCCYAIDRVSGEEDKYTGLFETEDWPPLERLMARFADAGIHYLDDASVFNARDDSQLKIIDFATHDVASRFL